MLLFSLFAKNRKAVLKDIAKRGHYLPVSQQQIKQANGYEPTVFSLLLKEHLHSSPLAETIIRFLKGCFGD
jgi:hypothetical protein